MWRTVYEISGVLGINPDPFSLRQLHWMIEGKNSEAWDHTSQLLAMINNCHCDKAISPYDRHPYKDEPEVEMPITDDITVLKALIPGN
jgi:hypothetical protein